MASGEAAEVLCVMVEDGARHLSKQVREVLEKSLTGREREESDYTRRTRS